MSNKIEEKIDTVETKIDNVQNDILDIKLTMAENTASLKEHMFRTDLNEEAINLLRKDIEPVKSHVQFVNNIAKFVAVVASILLFLKQMDII